MVTKNGIAGNWLWWNMVDERHAHRLLLRRALAPLRRVDRRRVRRATLLGKTGGTAARRARGLPRPSSSTRSSWVGSTSRWPRSWAWCCMFHEFEAIAVCLVFTGIYVTIGGLWSVLVTDLLQFVVKMSMAIVLAVAAVAAVGGIGDLRIQTCRPRPRPPRRRGSVLEFFPTAMRAWMPLMTFFVFIGVRGGHRRIPAPNPAAAAISRSASSRQERKELVLPRSSLTSRTTRYGPGPGSSSRSARWCSIRTG